MNYIKNSISAIWKDSGKVLALVRATAGRAPSEPETAQLQTLEGRVRKMFETAEAGTVRIGGVVELMRKYSREGFTRTIMPFDVFAAARDVVQLVLPATGREVQVETELAGEALVECVPEEFNQVLTNLVQNAIEAAPEGTGRVRVSGKVAEGQVELRVADNGPGMPAHVKENLFTPFFTTKGPGKGMGLGLTITWRVVKSLDGTIDVHSTEGVGTEFVVRVPAAAAGRTPTGRAQTGRASMSSTSAVQEKSSAP